MPLRGGPAGAIGVGTFNVHDARGRRMEPVADLILSGGVDVVAVQEVQPNATEWLAWLLGKREGGGNWSSAWAPADYRGNGLVSRFPLEDVSRQIMRPLGVPEGRSAALATVCAPAGRLPICATHLDAAREEARSAQWGLLAAALGAGSPGGFGGLLCGDLNALRRADYGDRAWREIAAVRARGRWEPPRTALLEAMEAAGFRDGMTAAGGESPGGTCRFDTRIDYLLAGPGFAGRFVRGSYRQLPARERRISDHDLVAVDVQLPR